MRVRHSRRREQYDEEDGVEALGVGRRMYSILAARVESTMRRREAAIVPQRLRWVLGLLPLVRDFQLGDL